MNRILKWVGLMAVMVLLLLAVGVWGLQRWIGTDDFRVRVAKEASQALGVNVKLARVDVTVWPLPGVSLGGIEIQTRPALTLEELAVRPAWSGLLRGRIELATVLVRQATLPQASIDSLITLLQKKKQLKKNPRGTEGENDSNGQYIPQRTVLDQVTWVSAKGNSITLHADARLSPQGLPDDVTVQILKGQLQGAKARLQRQGNDWTIAMEVGGGTVKGTAQLQPAPQPGAEFSLKGTLETCTVEVAALTSSAQPVLSGRLDADTTFTGRTASVGALADVLQTQSKFTVHKAVLHGIDLARAIKTVGLSRGGETALDMLAGQVHTQGRAAQLNNLVASSGVLSANGNVALAPSRALTGRVSVELGGAVGVPLMVGGTLDAPEVTLTRGALIGAAIGTVVMPGVGTGAGASMGDKVGSGLNKLFGR